MWKPLLLEGRDATQPLKSEMIVAPLQLHFSTALYNGTLALPSTNIIIKFLYIAV